jgi:hypothetical protein
MATPWQDYSDWFASNTPGTTKDWAAGTIERTETGATYTDPLGRQVQMTPESNLQSLYESSPYIAETWSEKYPGVFEANITGPELFQPDLYPYTKSVQGGSSSQKSSSYSGIPQAYQSELLSAIIPELVSTSQNLPEVIGTYTDEAQALYESMMRGMMEETMPQAIETLANRGMLQSSAAENILAQLGAEAADYSGQKLYETAMQAAQMRLGVPELLSQVAEVGKASTSKSSGSSSSSAISETANPLAPYKLLYDVLYG